MNLYGSKARSMIWAIETIGFIWTFWSKNLRPAGHPYEGIKSFANCLASCSRVGQMKTGRLKFKPQRSQRPQRVCCLAVFEVFVVLFSRQAKQLQVLQHRVLNDLGEGPAGKILRGLPHRFAAYSRPRSHQDVAERYLDSLWIEHGYGTRFQGFQNLMRRRIRDVLLVSSPYDLYLFEEDGRFYELIENEYHVLNLSHSPALTRVSSGKEAVALVKEERRFDLIITTLHIEDMTPNTLASLVREAGIQIPVVLLVYDNRELKDLETHYDRSVFDRVFVWLGNFRLLVAIIKHLEDRMNVDHDTRFVGVQSVILIEDNARFYSGLLPIIYTEILNQSKRLLAEGINLSHKYLRTVARPKILLCQTYEEAWHYYSTYRGTFWALSRTSISSQRRARSARRAEFAEAVRSEHADLPILLQSLRPTMRPRPEFKGFVFAEGFAQPPAGAAPIHERVLQLRRVCFPDPGWKRGRKSRRPDNARGAACLRTRREHRLSRRT